MKRMQVEVEKAGGYLKKKKQAEIGRADRCNSKVARWEPFVVTH